MNNRRRLMMAGLALVALSVVPSSPPISQPTSFPREGPNGLLPVAPPTPSVLRPHAILGGHAAEVACLAFSPDGKALAVGSRLYDSKTSRSWAEIKLWDVGAGKLRATWEGHTSDPAALAFSPDGKSLVSTTLELQRIVWNVATGKPERTLPPPGLDSDWMTQLRYSTDGKRIGACGSRFAVVGDVVSGKELFRHERKIPSGGSILSHDLRLLASLNHQDVDLWDVRTGRLAQSFLDHPGGTGPLSFSRDDRLLAVGCWRLREDETFCEVWLWDVPRGQRKRTIPIRGLYCRCVVLSPSGDLLAVAGAYVPEGPSELRLYETSSGKELSRLPVPPRVNSINHLMFRPDGRMLAASCAGRTVVLWAVE